MINPKHFYNSLKRLGVSFFTGVPDSLLKDICAYITDNSTRNEHILAVNEGGAIGLAVGHHLATNSVPVVYMQNSGIGNTVNPILSLADSDVYSIPMLLVIGWRGEPSKKDEPQHVKQGKLTLSLLKVMDIDYEVIDGEESEKELEQILSKLHAIAIEKSKPVALVVKKNTFSSYTSECGANVNCYNNNREDAIKKIVDCIEDKDFIVSTTGMASRELFEYRKTLGQDHSNDFLTVGGMGHASQIAVGIALSSPKKQIICIDGDGAALMHLGALAISGQSNLKNFKHIILNNGAHDSVGGQPTVGQEVSLSSIAHACGYNMIEVANNVELTEKIEQLKSIDGPAFLEILVDRGNRADLGRPTSSPVENKSMFMNKLNRG
ncbi:phosphonopyruvate decarboxylase [Aliivibrio kagoshimensis]|uniref:phosphonopyruvate decarboxylase n=1 Tax=Aliivibrio kagoshimensis TaxID=2910230 RepID=UPI003D0A4DF4